MTELLTRILSPSLKISRATWGDDWPLTVDAGVLQLRSGGRLVFIADLAGVGGGEIYAVNGTAKAEKHLRLRHRLRYQPIDEIWADDPERPGFKLSLGRLIDAGLSPGD